jgi:hypothetical protein
MNLRSLMSAGPVAACLAASAGLTAGCSSPVAQPSPAVVGLSASAAGRGTAASALRTSAQADAEHFPDSGVLMITLLPGSGATPEASTTRRITSSSTIARIASMINALPTLPADFGYCPADMPGTSLELDFAPTADAPLSASTRVLVPSRTTGKCLPEVEVSVDDAPEPGLYGSTDAELFPRLEQLAGITG